MAREEILDQTGRTNKDHSQTRWHSFEPTLRTPNERIKTEVSTPGELFDLANQDRGYGCPIYLGARHPEGNIGFVAYKWSEADKREFDQNTRVPCWIGSLSNETPMITLMPQYSQWRLEYAPTEGVPSEILALQDARSCFLICSSFHREFAHHRQSVWLIPSEYVSKVGVGAVKMAMYVEKTGRRSGYFKSPFFLKDKRPVDDFLVDNMKLHSAILELVSGKSSATIGRGGVQIQTSRYLKTVGEHRISTDVNMGMCIGIQKRRL